MRLDSPTDFMDEDKDENDVRNENIPEIDDEADEPGTVGSYRNKLSSDDGTSQDSGLGSEHETVR